jgi:hypothetical protein
MTNHMVVLAVEADDVENVRDLAFQGRLSQWNTCEIYPAVSFEDALARVEELPTVF